MNQRESAECSKPSSPPPQGAASCRCLHWSARIASLASLGVVAMFMIGEGFDPAQLKFHDWMLAVFFPFGLVFGLILGWRRELLGGGIVVFSFAAFYLVHLAQAGKFPSGCAFAVVASPGVLFLLSGTLRKPAPAD